MVRWKIIWLVVLVSALRSIDWMAFSIAAKQVMPEYGLNNVQIGTLFSALTLGYLAMTLPGGVLTDTIGPRRLLGLTLLLWSVLTALTAVAPELPGLGLLGPFYAFLVLRVIIGAAQGPCYPSCNKLVANWIPTEERGSAVGLVLASLGLGYALTPPAVAFIMVRYGWRPAFYLFGALGILLALWWYYYVTDLPEDHARLSAQELTRIRGAGGARARDGGKTAVPWQEMFAMRGVRLLTLVGFCQGYGLVAYQAWFYLYLIEARGFSALSAGVASTGPFVAIMLISPVWGWFCDNVVKRSGMTVGRKTGGAVGFTITAICIALGAAMQNDYPAVVLLSLGMGFLYGSEAVGYSAMIDIGGPYSGVLTGIVLVALGFGGVLAPIVTPLLARDYGWAMAFYAIALVQLTAAGLWLAIRAGDPIRVREAEPVAALQA